MCLASFSSILCFSSLLFPSILLIPTDEVLCLLLQIVDGAVHPTIASATFLEEPILGRMVQFHPTDYSSARILRVEIIGKVMRESAHS